jgi:hypothetical protein
MTMAVKAIAIKMPLLFWMNIFFIFQCASAHMKKAWGFENPKSVSASTMIKHAHPIQQPDAPSAEVRKIQKFRSAPPTGLPGTRSIDLQTA